jgi:hypothetical protein
VPAAYYVVLYGITVTYGMSWKELLRQLAKGDWITLPPNTDSGGVSFWQVYELYDIFPWDGSRIDWMALLRQVPMAFALFSVVLFGSCLDITAIQANLPYEVRSCRHSQCTDTHEALELCQNEFTDATFSQASRRFSVVLTCVQCQHTSQNDDRFLWSSS